jgi:Leucine-rich repeat (LRR) protein
LLAGVATVLSGCPTPDQIVIITDQNLDKAVRSALGQPFGFLTKASMLDLITLDAKQLGIRNLKGLENATNLTWLDLDTNNITDITPLTGLTNLQVLNLDANQLFDITPLAGLFNLDSLSLFGNQIGDIAPLVTNAVNNGLGPGDEVVLDSSTLNDYALSVEVPALQAKGVNVVLATAAK